MNHRILLMGSGLFLMFAVFSTVMFFGGYFNDAEGADKNGILALVCAGLTGAVFVLAMRLRKRAHGRIDAEVERELQSKGYIEASQLGDTLGMSLDETRDVLDRLALTRKWRREEFAGYNARYYPQL